MLGGSRWIHAWPYGSYEPERAREINELLEIASDHEDANDSEVMISEEPEPLDEDLRQRIEEAVWEIEEEIDALEARLEKVKRARDALENLIPDPYEQEDEDESESSP